MFETGRSVFTAAFSDIHITISVLKQQHPVFAQAFLNIRAKLNVLTIRNTIGETTETLMFLTYAEANSRRKAG